MHGKVTAGAIGMIAIPGCQFSTVKVVPQSARRKPAAVGVILYDPAQGGYAEYLPTTGTRRAAGRAWQALPTCGP